MATDETQKIVVEIPREQGYHSIPQTTESSKILDFKKGWIKAIVLPDNVPDLVFDITASVTIPALVSSCWVFLPIPNFLRIGGIIAVGVAALVIWQMLAIAEIKNYLILRLTLVAVGVVIGL